MLHNFKINNIEQQGTDTINAVIPMKYQKYPSFIILQHMNVLAKLNKFPYVSLLYMTPNEAYNITFHMRTMNI